MRIFIHGIDNWACGYHRAWLPVMHLYRDMAQQGVELHWSQDLATDESYYDAYVFSRMPSRDSLDFLKRVKPHAKIVWNLDDDLWDVPAWNPAYDSVQADLGLLPEMLDLADYCWVSTQALMDRVGTKGRLCPTLVDCSAWPPPGPAQGKPRVLWAGSGFHSGDLTQVRPALKRLVSSGVEVITFGADLQVKGVKVVQSVPLRHYRQAICQIGATIGLAPLQTHPFNSAKSSLKYAEYTLSGAVLVAQRGYYNDCQCAFADNDWFEVINLLVNNVELREMLLEKAREDVYLNHSWQGINRSLWWAAFRELAGQIF